MGSGGPRGLQILPPDAKNIRGGFDSHTFPPYISAKMRNLLQRSAQAIFLSGALLLCIAAPMIAAEPHPMRSNSDSLRAIGDTARVSKTETSSSDTVLARSPGTRFAPPSGVVWTMEELKEILDAENLSLVGKEYRGRKSGRIAMLCALSFPGLGQMYNEKPFKAAIAMGAETFYTYMILHNRRLWQREKNIRDKYPVNTYYWNFHDSWAQEYFERSVDWIWWSAGALIAIVLDAYVDAHLDDMRFEAVPHASSNGISIEFVMRY